MFSDGYDDAELTLMFSLRKREDCWHYFDCIDRAARKNFDFDCVPCLKYVFCHRPITEQEIYGCFRLVGAVFYNGDGETDG